MDETTTMQVQFSHNLEYELALVMALYDYDDHISQSKLRSDRLEPLAQAVFPDSCHTSYSGLVDEAFQRLLDARRGEFRGELPTNELIGAELSRPRSILVVDWTKSLFDGAVTPETDGFINDAYIPGWDSWLSLADVQTSYGKKCLICWVPADLAEKVNFGIEVDAASCMSWLSVEKSGISLTGWGESIS